MFCSETRFPCLFRLRSEAMRLMHSNEEAWMERRLAEGAEIRQRRNDDEYKRAAKLERSRRARERWAAKKAAEAEATPRAPKKKGKNSTPKGTRKAGKAKPRSPPVTMLEVCTNASESPSPGSQHMGGRSLGRRKVRHHVNPLKSTHQAVLDVPDGWMAEAFADPCLPLHVDIGCARGVFCLDLAAASSTLNVLGLEIRAPFAEAAAADAQDRGLGNAAFFACNANVNLQQLLERAGPQCSLQSASVTEDRSRRLLFLY